MYAYRARCDSQTAAQIIGCPPGHIRRLEKDGLLPRLNPGRRNVVAYFSTAALLALANNPKWLITATAHSRQQATQNQLVAARSAVTEAIQSARPRMEPGPAGSTNWIINEWIATLFRDARTGAPLPGSLGTDQVARILGFHPDDIVRLRRLGHLKCLNAEEWNAPKRHARQLVFELVTDFEWLSRATAALNKYWQRRQSPA
ncbi:MAG: hypothetical protein J0M24_02180 [Verrucomicrobia bacterium]|jgi:hypothetical protein|nr:hypothetical protein [Verrucomicrobiota bacterium]